MFQEDTNTIEGSCSMFWGLLRICKGPGSMIEGDISVSPNI